MENNNNKSKALFQVNDTWVEFSTDFNNSFSPDPQPAKGVQIRNYISKNQSTGLERIIQIHINGYVFKISDTFNIIGNTVGKSAGLCVLETACKEDQEDVDHQNPIMVKEADSNSTVSCSRMSSASKKIKKLEDSSACSTSNRDRKNLVKNFVKAFRTFINCVVEEQEIMKIQELDSLEALEKFRTEFEIYIQQKNFNNSLIVELIRSPLYKELFTFFLEQRAEDWIKDSKINDKESHLKALSEYVSAIKNDRGLAKMRILRYKNFAKTLAKMKKSQ